jgi:hypothetical protein
LDFLCSHQGEESGNGILDSVGNAGSAADISKPLVAIGVNAAGISRIASPLGAQWLGSQVATGLGVLGNIGTTAAYIGIFSDVMQGKWQDFVYDSADLAVYNYLAKIGAAGAVETLGGSVVSMGLVAGVYYGKGGSKKIVQSSICP